MPVTGLSFNLTGTDVSNFSINQTCGTSIAAHASCNMYVRFLPTEIRSNQQAVVNVTSAAGSYALNASGAGAPIPTPQLSVSQTTIDFGSNAVGASASPVSVSFSNTGTGPFTINSASLSGTNAQAFSIIADTCSNLTIPALTSNACSITISLIATQVGSYAASLDISDSIGSHPISLSGSVGSPATIHLNNPSLSFANRVIGSTSSPIRTILSNIGDNPLSVYSITPPNGFNVVADTCSGQIVTTGSCYFDITFSPTQVISYNNPVVIASSDPSTPSKSITALGSGLDYTYTATPNVSSISFGSQTIGTTSTAHSVTLPNTGNSPTVFGTITPPTGYSISANTCTGSLAPSANCQISLRFSPTSTSVNYNTSLTIPSNATAGNTIISLTGAGADVFYLVDNPDGRFSTTSFAVTGNSADHDLSTVTKMNAMASVGAPSLLIPNNGSWHYYEVEILATPGSTNYLGWNVVLSSGAYSQLAIPWGGMSKGRVGLYLRSVGSGSANAKYLYYTAGGSSGSGSGTNTWAYGTPFPFVAMGCYGSSTSTASCATTSPDIAFYFDSTQWTIPKLADSTMTTLGGTGATAVRYSLTGCAFYRDVGRRCTIN